MNRRGLTALIVAVVVLVVAAIFAYTQFKGMNDADDQPTPAVTTGEPTTAPAA